MGHSSLLGTEEAPTEAPGRDVAVLGPGDNSDSGSDMMGITEDDAGGDADLPVDVALRDDHPHSFEAEGSAGSTSDAAGTGERRSAASDAGPEAADIGVDRIVAGPDLRELPADDEDVSDDEDADLAFIDDAQAGDPVEDEEEEVLDDDGDAAESDPDNLEEGDNIPQGRRRGAIVEGSSTPSPPGRPNPEPDVPAPVPGDSDEEIPPPADEQDADERRPGRTAALLRRPR